MRNNKSLVILAVFGLMLFGVSAAQAGGGVYAGLSLPMGDFGDGADMGYHGGVSFSMPAAPTLSIGGMGSYHYWGIKDSNESGNMIEALGFAKLTTPGGLFGMVGLGLGSGDDSAAGSERTTDLASALGGGYSLTMIDVTVLYHMVSTEGSNTNFLTISAGIGF